MSYPHTYIKLTAKERQEVINWLNKLARAYRIQARKRVQSIYYSDRGKTIEEIAKELEVTDRSLHRQTRLAPDRLALPFTFGYGVGPQLVRPV